MTDGVVYYFSGTGNSYAVARDIAEKIDAELIPIAKVVPSERVKVPTKVMGIVFPDYHSSLPNIVGRFMDKIESLNDQYLFGVCTYGGSEPGLTMRYLEQRVESSGERLAAGFAVGMPYNYIKPSIQLGRPMFKVQLRSEPVEKRDEKISQWKERRGPITDFIKNRRIGVIETSSEILLKIIGYLRLKDSLGKYIWLKMAGYPGDTDLSFHESCRLMDYGFSCTEDCISCGTCERICPVDNIVMAEGRPNWLHNCEQCFACLQWCPQEAIQYGDNTEDCERHHHPEVEARDLMI
jgi:ferredoxin